MRKLLTIIAGALVLGAVSTAIAAEAKLKVIDLAVAFAAPADHEGHVGLAGKVAELDAKQRSFVLVSGESECMEACCASERLTVEVPAAQWKGKLPKVGDTLVAVGDLTPLTVGFDLAISEVRRGDKVLLSRKTK